MKRITVYFTFLCLLGLYVNGQNTAVFSVNGKAIKGYDPVGFFKEGKPLIGFDSLVHNWQGANWFFASQSDLDSFKVNPEKYAPQYGGYCAYGTAEGHKAPTEADTWTIVDGKLYFNYNKKVKEYWLKDQASLIKKAATNWPGLKDKE